MSYNFGKFNEKIKGIEDWLKDEFSTIRTGRATITLLDSVVVEAYGEKSPINQHASISIEDPKTLRISPWDKGIITAIEKAISTSDLGVSTSVDEAGIRVKFPDLTTENRERLVKLSKTKIEEAKVSLRSERNKVSNDIQDKQKAGELSEDDAKRSKDDMQKIVDKSSKGFEELGKKKENEIMF